MQVYPAGGKKMVIEKQSDLLTLAEMTIHVAEIMAANREELAVWIRYKCFVQAPDSRTTTKGPSASGA